MSVNCFGNSNPNAATNSSDNSADCDGVSYTWTGQGINEIGQSVSINAPNSADMYTYTVTATKSGCTSKVTTATLTVTGTTTPPPTGSGCDFNLSGATANPTSVPVSTTYVGLTVQCTGNDCLTEPSVQYYWSGQGVDNVNAKDIHFTAPPTAGMYTYTVTATKSGCASKVTTATLTVTGTTTPPPTGSGCDFNLSGATANPTSVPVSTTYVGLTVQCTGNDCLTEPSVQYYWSGQGVDNVNAKDIHFTAPPTAGMYTYTVTATKSGCASKVTTATLTVTGTTPINDPCAGNSLSATSVSNLMAGLNYNYYSNFSSGNVDELATQTAVYTGTVPTFSLSAYANRAGTNYGYEYTGYINVPNAGQYTFTTTSDDGSKLWIDDVLVVDNNGGHENRPRTGTVCLDAGLHRIKVRYSQGEGDQSLTVSWQGPGVSGEISANVLFHQNTSVPTTDPCAGNTYPATSLTNPVAGLNYNYFEGFSDSDVDKLQGLAPTAQAVVDNFLLNAHSHPDNNYGYEYNGYIYIANPGQYTFSTSSDDGSLLRIDNHLVVDNNGIHGAVEQTGVICLAAGYHPIQLRYGQVGGGIALTVSWQGPGVGKMEIPASVLFHQATSTPPTTPTGSLTYTSSYDCSTGLWQLGFTGGDGSAITARCPGVFSDRPFSLNTPQSFTIASNQLTGVSFTITVTQGGTPYSFTFVSSCSSTSPKPPAPTVNSPAVCAGQPATLTATGCSGQYVWSTGETTSSITLPASVLTTSTTFTVRCRVNGQDSDPATSTVNVNPLPGSYPKVKVNQADFLSLNSYSVCVGDNIAFGMDRDPNLLPGYTLHWSGPNGTQEPDINNNWILYSVGVAQMGTYVYQVIDNKGCSSTATVNISLAAPNYEGNQDPPTCTNIHGWLVDRNCPENMTGKVRIVIDGVQRDEISLTADRLDVRDQILHLPTKGNGLNLYGFSWAVPIALQAGRHEVRIYDETGQEFAHNSPLSYGVYAPTLTGSVVCSGQTATLTATDCAGTVIWPDGTTGSSFTTPILTQTTTYTAVCTTPDGCRSLPATAVATVSGTCGGTDPNPVTGSLLTLLAPDYNCATHQFTFLASGGDGTPIRYAAVGVTGWTTKAGLYTVTYQGDTQPFTLSACQGCDASGNGGYLTTYSWNPVAYCTIQAPVVSLRPAQPLFCGPTSVTLTANGCQAGSTTRWWNGSTGQTLVVTLDKTTTVGAVCTQNGIDSPLSNTFTVGIQPVPVINGVRSLTYAQTLSLTAVAAGNTGITWYGPAGFVRPENPLRIISMTSSEAGQYTAVAAFGSSCSTSAVVTIGLDDPKNFTCTCQDCELSAVKDTDDPAIAASNTGSADQNYVQESVYLDAGGNHTAQTITYIDGIGRPVQKVTVGTGGKAGAAADVVSLMTYDGFGREPVKYLPFAPGSNSGAFRTAGAGDVSSYYGSLSQPGNPYTAITYESSPLSRVTKQIAPGTDPTPMTMAYRTNAAGELPLLTFDYGSKTFSVGSYGAGQLYVTESTDENNNKTTEYKDKEGRVVGKDVSGRKTLYGYDDMNRLRVVVPPKASPSVSGSLDPFAGELVFGYEYDERGRMTQKRVPGAGTTSMTYDSRDRLSTTTDAKGTTITTDYDPLDRVTATRQGSTVLTRMFYDTYGAERKAFDASQTYGITARANTTGMATSTQTRILESSIYLTSSTYYDDLGRVIQTVADNHKGGVDYASSKLDFLGRVTESKLSTLNGLVVENRTSYDIGSRVKAVCQRVTDGATAAGGVGQYWEPVARHSYNGIGELTQKTLGCGIQNLDYTYQIRGWLAGINNPGNLNTGPLPADKDYFGMQLGYDKIGNIMTWDYATAQRKGDRNTQPYDIVPNQPYSYAFSYDNLNRLNTGTLTQQGQPVFVLGGAGNGPIGYDDNGNITSLKRTFQNALVDDLTYTYKNGGNSNQLASVGDGGSNPGTPNAFFKDGTAGYDYDANGNLKSDNGKGIGNIDYNYLNLPKTVTKGGQPITYTYSASGQKLKVDFGGGKTYDYVAGLVYDKNGLEFIPTAEGRILPPGRASTTITTGSADTATNQFYRYEYQLKDHLGNLRIACRCGEKAVAASPSDTQTPLVVQENHYDPFGLDLSAIGYESGVDPSRLKYINRELQPGLGWYDLQARFFDPDIGRFTTIDPQTEDQEHLSPYHYSYDNPIRFSDPNGLIGDDCCGGIISYAAGVISAIRDDFFTPDGRSVNQDRASDAGLYNTGREHGHIASVVGGAIGVADGLLRAAGGVAVAVASEGALSIPAAALIAEGVAQAGISLNGGKNAINNLQNDNGRVNADKSQRGSEEIPHSTSRQARRDAMRQEGIPTSQQALSQKNTPAGRTLDYETPKPGGGTSRKQAQQQLKDSNHGPHWEVGSPKSNGQKDPIGRDRLQNGKSKSFYEQ